MLRNRSSAENQMVFLQRANCKAERIEGRRFRILQQSKCRWRGIATWKVAPQLTPFPFEG
jgi:hypothetical protein